MSYRCDASAGVSVCADTVPSEITHRGDHRPTIKCALARVIRQMGETETAAVRTSEATD